MFRFMQVVEARFRKVFVQITDDPDSLEDDETKVNQLRELAYMAFKSYCDTVMHAGESRNQTKLENQSLATQERFGKAANNNMTRLE